MENFKKIQEVYKKLSQMREFKKVYELSDIANFRAKECMNLIREFLVDNDKSRKVKKNDLSVWNFVGNDPIRPVMNNVHYNHEDKVAVASDGRKLFVSHKDYRPLHQIYDTVEIKMNGEKTKKEIEYEVYDKYDNGVEGRYPNYKGVIPHDNSLTPVTLASEEEITKRIAEAKAEHKLLGLAKPDKRIAISVMGEDKYGVDFTFRNLAVSMEHVNFMLSAGLDGWQIKFEQTSEDHKEVRMFVKKFENGDIILLMPIYITIDNDKDATLEQINNIKFKNFDKDIC